ncbi:MAG: hypothetical protein DRG31_08055 [Deltaproteobacteria bacterium]|nr:MAG: hypothetical protein DRG31_08055 [Deltaproteobacteria bacterium]
MATAMFIAIIILAMSLLVYSAGSRYQTLRREPTREIVQTITDDFKRVLTLALRKNLTEPVDYNTTLTDWVKNLTCYYSGWGLQLKLINLPYFTNNTLRDRFDVEVDSTLGINITSIGFYGYEYPAQVKLSVTLTDATVNLDENTVEVNLTAFNENGPASDLEIQFLNITFIYRIRSLEQFSVPIVGDTSIPISIPEANFTVLHVVTNGTDVSTIDGIPADHRLFTAGNPRVETWYWSNISTVTINFSQPCKGIVWVFGFENVNTTNPIGSWNSACGSGSEASVDITTSYNDSLIISVIGALSNKEDFEILTGCNWSERYNWSDPIVMENYTLASGVNHINAPSKRSYSFNWSFNKQADWAALAVEIRAMQMDVHLPSGNLTIYYVSGSGEYMISGSLGLEIPDGADIERCVVRIGFVDSRGIGGVVEKEVEPSG